MEDIIGMKEYGVKVFEIEGGVETEIEMDELPDDYISGLIKMLKDTMIRRERLDRVYRKMAENIKNKEENNVH